MFITSMWIVNKTNTVHYQVKIYSVITPLCLKNDENCYINITTSRHLACTTDIGMNKDALHCFGIYITYTIKIQVVHEKYITCIYQQISLQECIHHTLKHILTKYHLLFTWLNITYKDTLFLNNYKSYKKS